MAGNEMERKKRTLTRDISGAYYTVVYLQNKLQKFSQMDSLYSRYSRAAEISYRQGEQSYLEMLNAQSKQNQITLRQRQIEHDIRTAMDQLAALMHYDSLFTVPEKELIRLDPLAGEAASDPGLKYLQNGVLQQQALVNVEKNRLLPDLTLSYFNGSNRYAGSRNYQGFEVGIGIPLFFSEQRGRIKAGQHSMDAAINLQAHYVRQYQHRVTGLMTGIHKYEESIRYYEESGQSLSRELSRYAEQSYAAGEIDFFRFVQSLDNAIEIELNYLDNLFEYNKLVLEINFLTL